MDDVTAAIKALDGKTGVGAAVRRSQLVGSQGAITFALNELFKLTGDIIRSGQQEAALAALDAQLEDEQEILELLYPDSKEREAVKESLRVTAQRQVQAMMTRILKSERPLSRRIYRTEAISKNQVGNIVNGHLARGSSADDIAKDVRSFFNPNVPGGVSYAAKRLARSEINNAFHAQSIQDMEDRPWIDKVKWNLSKTHDEQGCVCEQYATQLFTPDNVPGKPHPQCFSGDTVVSAKSVRAIAKRRYEGRFIDVFLAEDSPKLSGTPNHPAFTQRGWVPLSELRHGDYVAVNCGLDELPGVHAPHDDHVVSRLDDLYKSLVVTGGMTPVAVPQASEQFHGDGSIDGEVYIVRTDGLLENSGVGQIAGEQDLVIGDAGLPSLSGDGPLDLLGSSSNSASSSCVSCGGLRHRVLEGERFASASEGLLETGEHGPDLHQTESDDFRSLSEGLSGSVRFQRVLGIGDRPGGFDGHVYSLQTESGWYYSNSIAVKNCMCYVTPELIPYEQFAQNLAIGHYNKWIEENAA